MSENSINIPFIPEKICLFDFATKKGYTFENKTKRKIPEVKKMRLEGVEMIMKLTGMPIEDGVKLAFKTLDDTYAAFPRLEKPEFVILNGKEYPRPKA